MKPNFLLLFFVANLVVAQTDSILKEQIFDVDALTDTKFVEFIGKVSPNNQFVLIGEQHGIEEAGTVTNVLFDLLHGDGFNTLCIETDALAAQKIETMAASKDALKLAEALSKKYPLAIPFYNNAADYDLFTNVVSKGGKLWGIDQTFMAQFRLTFDHLSANTENASLKKLSQQLQKRAEEGFAQSLENKSFQHMFLNQYTDALHDSLMATNPNPDEAKIIAQLKKTKEIYGYYNTKDYYLNNEVRGQLMKSNFNAYYKQALKTEPIPKVIFKLGATHATRGLSMTNIYDVSNYLSELAVFNNMRSLHFVVAGIAGKALQGNPFAANPIQEFDNSKQLPDELQEIIPNYGKKYVVVHLEPLRKKTYGKLFSESLKEYIFNFDILVLVNGAEPLIPFN